MKIYYLSSSIIPSQLANSVNVMKMCEAFAYNGHEVTLFARHGAWLSSKDIFASYGVGKVFQIRRSWRPKNIFPRAIRTFIYLWQVKHKVQTSKSIPDLFYGRDIDSFVALQHLKIPMIFEEHDGPNNDNKLAKQEFIFKQPHFAGLVVITEALREKYLRLFPDLLANKVIVAHSGADASSRQGALINKWAGRPDSLQVGYVGHLYPGKGMEIISQLAPMLQKVDFHIVGGTDSDIAYWKRQCPFNNLIFHGFVDHAKLDAYFSAFDVLLAPYTGDNHGTRSPLKITEYMAACKAIISSDYPAFREILVDEKNCLLASPKIINQWVEAIQRMDSNPELRTKLAEQAFADFSSRYSWRKRAEAVLRV